MASTSGPQLPWDGPLQNMAHALTGGVAHWAVIIAIAVSGIGVALGESGGVIRRGGTVILGGSIAAGAMQVANALGIAGALI